MGLYNVQDSEPLKTWLVKNLDAISDADPTALAKYILELLNMWTNDPESQVKSRLSEELEDFLQGEATPFTDRLLAALRSKSYLPYSAMADAPQSFNKQPRGRKRSLEQDDQEISQERDLKGPPKGPRIHGDRGTRRIPDAPRNHHQRTNGREPGHFRDRGNGPPNPNGSNFAPPGGMGHPNQRERCNDYYNFGVCNRGAACPYSHGDDAVVSNGLPFVPPIPPAMALQMLNGLFPPAWQAGFMGPPNGPPAPYDPLYGHGGTPLQPMHGSNNDVIQDLTPREPRNHRESQFQASANPTPDGVDNTAMEDVHLSENTTVQPERRTNHDRPPHSGRGFGGRGGRPERMNRSSVVDPNSVTIVVEKLPPEKANMQDLTAYFSRFGSVTNVAVDRRGNRALVSFSTHQEAHAAWKSEEAVFGNRFVVIFWHRPAPGGGAVGQKALEASATTVQKINAAASGSNEDTVMADDDSAQQKADYNPVAAVGSTRKQEPKSPQEIFEYASRIWMEKMKGVMDILQSTTASESEKQDAKTKFNVLKAQKPAPPSAAAKPTEPTTLKKKESVDLDLDMLANGQGQTLTQEEAQQTIAKLQALAAEQGLDPNELEEEETRMSNHAFGGFRGRGRGRGWRGGYRGRGRGAVLAMANASLDNRSKRISLKGYDKDGISDDNALDIIQNYYMPTGQAESVEKGESGEIIISYPTRAAAELAVRSGVPSIEGLGNLSMQWHNQPKPKVNGDHTTAPPTNNVDKDAASHAESWGAKRAVRGGGDEDDGHEGWGS